MLEDLVPDGTSEGEARMALIPLLEAAIEAVQTEPSAVDPTNCPNCGVPEESTKSPFCSKRCREEAGFVRRLRVALSDDEYTPDRIMMLGQAFWFLMGGGRPSRVAIAPASAIRQVFKRTDGKCESCGAPATTVDNVGSG